MSNEDVTPVRRQYLEAKKQYPDTIVFFRLGDFYETFDEDAEITARELDIVLPSRPIGGGSDFGGVMGHVEKAMASLNAAVGRGEG